MVRTGFANELKGWILRERKEPCDWLEGFWPMGKTELPLFEMRKRVKQWRRGGSWSIGF